MKQKLEKIPFINDSPIFKPDDIIEVLDSAVNDSMVVSTGQRKESQNIVKVYEVPASFDIETTSLYVDSNKAAVMYEWTFGINGKVIIGRTWEEFTEMIDNIVVHLHLADDKRLIVYVHNLSFEFQFMRKHFKWIKIFAIDARKPIYAITDNGIEFRCSYLLSGYSLAKLGDELQKYKVQKMSGDLDYSLMRHSKTVLTDKELKYCENDVRVVMAYIKERIEIDGSITKIPYTKTGYVRNYCRNACLYTGANHKRNVGKYASYHNLMQALTLDATEYQQLKRAFQGGFTHANALYSEQELENVASYDFTSSYPYVMVSEMFPMSKGRLVNGNGQLHSVSEFQSLLKHYCCVFDVKLYGVMTKVVHENPLSYSRCFGVKNEVLNNGRIVCADELGTTMTEQDYFIYQYFYSWDKMEIANFRVYEKGYLPTDFVKSILKLYSDKTTLKGVKGKEIEYLAGKGMLNATYGMAVTDICRDENIYTENGIWEVQDCDVLKSIDDYNNSKKRFLFYPWGVWVTAYARRNLFTGIIELDNDYVYSDTDSVKVLNHEKHKAYFENYNAMCRVKLERACEYHKIPFDSVEPSTIKGVKKLLGVWDFEGVYKRFKTLGAKRYMVEESDGEISLTVSGVNKGVAVPYLLDAYGNDGIFDAFTDALYIPPYYSGKNTHTYIDDVAKGVMTDYNGVQADFEELSGVHLEKADYSLSMSVAYLDYIRGVRTIER